MNIFEILSQGKGAINEENVSAFLAYLLNPNETHGLKDIFFRKFITAIDKDLSTDDTLSIDNIELEVPFFNKSNKNKRVIDILIECTAKINEKYIIAIENKIDESAIKKDQVKEEIENICSSYRKGKKTHLIFIFLTPTSELKYETNNLNKEIIKKCSYTNISWKNNVIPTLKSLLADEFKCKISPITDYVKQTIKSFICYINNFNEAKIKKAIQFKMWSDKSKQIERFCMKRYSSNQIKLYKDDDKSEVLNVKGTISKFIYEKVDKSLENRANTQTLGRILIQYLETKDGKEALENWNTEQTKNPK